MKRVWVLLAAAMATSSLRAEPQPTATDQCLSCHVQADGSIDIVGLEALSALPPEWPYLFEDAYDLDGDGIAGVMRYVSGSQGPLPAKFGTNLAAAKFEDFAKIAGRAHNIVVTDDIIEEVRRVFAARSPNPKNPFADRASLETFLKRGCADCHVTRTYQYQGQTVMPLSDFLLHDLGEGLKRTAPLWGCNGCTEVSPHVRLTDNPIQ